MEAVLGSSLDRELEAVMLGSDDTASVEIVLDSSAENEVDGTSLSCEVLGIAVEPAVVLIASVELSSTVEELTSTLLVDRGDSVLSWAVELGDSSVLVENPDSVGAEVVSSPLLVPVMLAEASVELSRLLGSEPVKDDDSSKPLVEVGSGLADSVDAPAEVSELSKDVGCPLVSMALADSVDSVLLSNAVLAASVETNDVPLLRRVLSVSVGDREVEMSVGWLCDDDCDSVDSDSVDSASVDNEASLLVLTSVEDGPGVGPEVGVTSVETLP